MNKGQENQRHMQKCVWNAEVCVKQPETKKINIIS